MEASDETVDAPRRSYPAERLAMAAAICIFSGIGVFAASAVLDHWTYHSDRAGLRTLAGVGLWASLVSAYVAAPLLGIIAMADAARNKDRRTAVEDGRRVRRSANWLLIASALLILVTLLPVALRVAHAQLAAFFVALSLVGVQMGRVSRRLAKTAGAGRSWSGMLAVGAVVLILMVIAFGTTGVSRYVVQRVTDAAKVATFSGNSQGLSRTVVVPTLDSPSPQGQNIIWCSSFQLAWNEVRDNVIGAPLEVPEAAELAARLNAATQSISDLDPKSVYAAGGWVEKGIREKIKQDMAAKFPSHTPPDFNDFTGGILAYSYLTAHVPFEYPFREKNDGLTFTDSQGIQTQAAGFGLWQAFLPRYKNLREQVEVLYARSKDRSHSWELTEYAIDLCRHSTPYQVVVARVEPKNSLVETLEHVRTEIADFKKTPYYDQERQFAKSDELMVPEMFWRIDHRFEELIGKGVANVGMPIVEAFQTIEFRLDRSGAMLESEAMVAIAALPRRFDFNRPFLVYIQKRGAEHPFFVMWVDNAELLVRK